MKDLMEYNGYLGSVHFDSEDEIFYGKIEGIEDIISFEGKSLRVIAKNISGRFLLESLDQEKS